MFINELEKGLQDDSSNHLRPPTPEGLHSKRNSRRTSGYPHLFLRPNKSEVSIEVESASDSEPKKIDEEENDLHKIDEDENETIDV